MSGKDSIHKSLSVPLLVLMTLIAIINIREIPIMASIGKQSVFFYSFALLAYLIPSSLAVIFFAKRQPKNNGGVYSWVSMAFNKRIGAIAIWLEWVNNIIGMPATLATAFSILAYVFWPGFLQHKWILLVAINTTFILLTRLNARGIHLSASFSRLGALVGVVLPSLVLIALGAYWQWRFPSSRHLLTQGQWLPAGNLSAIALLVSVFSSYSGIQVTAFHYENIKQPTRTLPLAIIISIVLIFLMTVASSLAINCVLPATQVSYLSGIIAGFQAFFNQLHLSALTPYFAVVLFVAAIASLSTWLLAPARGLAVASDQGFMPKQLSKRNHQQMPINILKLQVIVVALLSLLLIVGSTVQVGFWMLIAFTSQFTMAMYLLIFTGAIKLAWSESVPAIRKTLFCTPMFIGVVATLLGFSVGLFPPESLHIKHRLVYFLFMILTDVTIIGLSQVQTLLPGPRAA